MPNRQDLEALLRENLPRIERILALLCRRRGMTGDDAEDFASWAKMRLIENDYAILGKFRGEGSLGTYLTLVIATLLREYRGKEWGRWRPSAAALLLGPVGVRLEALVYRDGFTRAQAAEVLRTVDGDTLSDREVAAMLARIPPRRPPVPPELDLEALAAVPAYDHADDLVIEGEMDRERRRIEEALLQSLECLPDEDRWIVRLRFWQAMSVADVGRALSLPQKPLYRRLERAFWRLRKHLEERSVTRERVGEMLAGRDKDPVAG